jgi:hypothetical protein
MQRGIWSSFTRRNGGWWDTFGVNDVDQRVRSCVEANKIRIKIRTITLDVVTVRSAGRATYHT